MPARNVEIIDIELSNVEVNDTFFAPRNDNEEGFGLDEQQIEISANVTLSISDSGLLPTIGNMMIKRMYLIYSSGNQSAENSYSLNLIEDEQVNFGKTSFVGNNSYETKMNVETTYRPASGIGSETDIDELQLSDKSSAMFAIRDGLCNGNVTDFSCEYDVTGVVTTKSNNDTISTNVSGESSGTYCEYLKNN